MTLKDRILHRESGLLFYGLAPPKATSSIAKIQSIADKQISRLSEAPIDGLVLYDIQDEKDRTNKPRPFPFLSTVAPEIYGTDYLCEIAAPKIIYKSVSQFSGDSFQEWLQKNSTEEGAFVFVGAPSKNRTNTLTLQEAYQIRQKLTTPLPLLGGVTIPERHLRKGDEPQRIFSKISNGCSFFISQCVYNAANAKKFLDDYRLLLTQNNKQAVPLFLTLTPCGSEKTMQLMDWLGIAIPYWLRNDLARSHDTLATSIDACLRIAEELLHYAKDRDIPLGFNIESVSIKKEEIDASLELTRAVRSLLDKNI